MLQSVRELMLPAAQVRLLLLVNHVVSREPAALSRLSAHNGRRVAVELIGQPSWLPALPPMRILVTPAGLFEREDGSSATPPDLTLRFSIPRPEQLFAALTGSATPEVRIEGMAAMAADMHWLADNLRWDIEADLAEVLGPTASRVVVGTGRSAALALRGFVASSATPPSGTPR
jgi:ubiquinone biosynthesis protein UbiJ